MSRRSLAPRALVSPLRQRPFALLWGGQATSHLGDAVHAVALPWLVYDLTNSPTAMGSVLLLFSVAMMLALPAGGVLADRLERRYLMLLTDLVRGIAMAGAAGLAAGGEVQIWHLQVLVVVVGAAAGVFLPTQMAIVPDLVTRDDLPAANALSSSSRSLATIAGPLVGAVLVAAGGPALALGFDALTFLVSGLCLLAMRAPQPARTERPSSSPADELTAGLRVVATCGWLRAGIVLLALATALTQGPRFVLLPQLVRVDLGGGVELLGALQSATAIGLVAGTLAVGQWGRGLPRGATFYTSLGISGLALGALGLASETTGTLALAAVLGASTGMVNVIWTASQQEMVPGDLLGRVTSIDLLATALLMPIGFGGAGLLAEATGTGLVFAIGGLGTAIFALLGLLWPDARRFTRPAVLSEAAHPPPGRG